MQHPSNTVNFELTLSSFYDTMCKYHLDPGCYHNLKVGHVWSSLHTHPEFDVTLSCEWNEFHPKWMKTVTGVQMVTASHVQY